MCIIPQVSVSVEVADPDYNGDVELVVDDVTTTIKCTNGVALVYIE